MPAPVQRLDHALELAHLLAAAAGGGVLGVRGEVADRAVAPVVGAARFSTQEASSAMWWTGSSSTAVTPSDAQVLERRLGGQPGVGAAQVLAHVRVAHREALHVRLVDDRVGATGCAAGGRPPSRSPGRSPPHLGMASRRPRRRARGRRRRRRSGTYGSTLASFQLIDAVDRLRVGVDQELVVVEAVALGGRVGAVDAVAVALARADARQVAVPVERGALADLDAGLLAVARRTGRARRARRSRRTARSSCPARPTSRRAGRASPARPPSPDQAPPRTPAAQRVRRPLASPRALPARTLPARHGTRAGAIGEVADELEVARAAPAASAPSSSKSTSSASPGRQPAPRPQQVRSRAARCAGSRSARELRAPRTSPAPAGPGSPRRTRRRRRTRAGARRAWRPRCPGRCGRRRTGTGARSPYSSPMNSIGVNGDSSVQNAASGRASSGRRSP